MLPKSGYLLTRSLKLYQELYKNDSFLDGKKASLYLWNQFPNLSQCSIFQLAYLGMFRIPRFDFWYILDLNSNSGLLHFQIRKQLYGEFQISLEL